MKAALSAQCSDIAGKLAMVESPRAPMFHFAKGVSRPAAARLAEIRLRCEAGRLPTAPVLSAHFGVSTKTIWRDLEELRNEGFGIDWDVDACCFLTTLPPRSPMVPLRKLPLNRRKQ